MAKTYPTQQRLNECLYYDDDIGQLRRKNVTSGRGAVGDIAGSLYNNGYRRIKIDGVGYQAHHLVFSSMQRRIKNTKSFKDD